jgi:hypothetical protein
MFAMVPSPLRTACSVAATISTVSRQPLCRRTSFTGANTTCYRSDSGVLKAVVCIIFRSSDHKDQIAYMCMYMCRIAVTIT